MLLQKCGDGPARRVGTNAKCRKPPALPYISSLTFNQNFGVVIADTLSKGCVTTLCF